METVLLYILGILIIVVGLALSIGLHEIGHLVPAKLFGVRVSQYMIGFGPTLFSRRRGETEYGVKAIPLGGYISMAGMYPPARVGAPGRTATTGMFQTLVQEAGEVDADVDESRTFYRLSMWKRIIIMFGGPFMNLVIAVVLYAIVLCGFGIPQATTTVGSISECVIPQTSQQTECTADDPAAPAAAAGFKPGDRIISVDGTAVDSPNDASSVIRGAIDQAIPVVVERDGRQVELTVTPIANQRYETDEQGKTVTGSDGKPIVQTVGFIGIGYLSATVPQPVTAVLPAVGDNVAGVVNVVLHLPQRVVDIAVAVFGPGQRDPNGPIGIVGIGRLAGEITSYSGSSIADRASTMIGMVASLNVALFVFNLIPLPPLDGGHIAAAIIDGIRRGFSKLTGRPKPRPIDVAKILPVTFAVSGVLACLTVLLVIADIFKPITLL